MIIGLVGFKQVGKSTAAKYLAEKGFVRHNFKDALVAELKKNFPDLLEAIRTNTMAILMKDVTIDDLFELKPPLMRALLQNYGTEVRRGDRDDYWTLQWQRGLYNKDISVVTDDVRFINEGIAVKEKGGILIRLTRPDITTGGTHKSETEQLEIEADHTIECEPGDHNRLYAELDKILLA